MKICSWNIEHFRFEKVVRVGTNNFDVFHQVVSEADISFFYEGKTEGTAALLAAEMNKKISVGDAVWVGMGFWSLNEYVGCIYNTSRISKVEEMSGYTAAIASVSPGERLPPVIQIHTAKKGPPVTVAPWHCYGPAKQMTSLIFPKLTRKLFKVGVSLFFGDFNFEGRGKSALSRTLKKMVSPNYKEPRARTRL